MVGVALPSISTDLGMSTSSLQWVVSAYVLGYGGFLLLGGRAADLLGRRRMFLISLAVFAVASAFGGLVDDGSLLVASRFIKGVAAAFTAPAGLSIITTTFAEGPARNKAIAVYTVVQAPEAGSASPRTLASLSGVVALIAGFTALERRTAEPLARLGILRSSALVRANLGAMSLFGGWVGFQFIATLYMQQARGCRRSRPGSRSSRPAWWRRSSHCASGRSSAASASTA